MKKILIIAFLALLAFSCQQSELEFSCDPVINKFVIENQEELSTIAVQELGSYDLQLEKAIFNSWDYQKKRSAWVDKLQYVMIHIPFSELEKAHIQALIVHINEDYFLKENFNKNLEIRSQFASQWISYAINNLGWSNQFIAFMVYRLYTDQSQFDSELSMLKQIGKIINTESESGSCDCNVSSDFCGSIDCHSGGCSITSGCGWVWSMTCDGSCY
jgi:hypothetical protein